MAEDPVAMPQAFRIAFTAQCLGEERVHPELSKIRG
jgi:hypothetical protein